jgi:hypothetical protein
VFTLLVSAAAILSGVGTMGMFILALLDRRGKSRKG